jgi:NAD(P)-dependent dehydrogenase (short-subunit alcohol dehydrogenase family)
MAAQGRGDLEGKVAAVVGGGGGIGAAVTRALANEGASVAYCDIDEAALGETRAAVDELGASQLAHHADALVPAELDGFFTALDGTFDRLDVLVNVVGGVLQRDFVDTTPADWDDDINRNYRYVVQSMHSAITRMRAGGRGGSIISFTTIEAGRGAARFSVYAGAKAAVTNFSRSLAVEMGPEAIRINTVAPDTTPSAGNMRAVAGRREGAPVLTPEQGAASIGTYIPLGRPPAADDLADAVVFLASDRSRAITGTTLHVDGGTWAASGFLNWPHGDGWLPVPGPNTASRMFPIG